MIWRIMKLFRRMPKTPVVPAPTSRIVLAAVSYNGKIWTGKRHGVIMQDIWAVDAWARIHQDQQGFVTDTGEFVDRAEAGRIAFQAGQTSEQKLKLLSEHVW